MALAIKVMGKDAVNATNLYAFIPLFSFWLAKNTKLSRENLMRRDFLFIKLLALYKRDGIAKV